MGKDKVRGRLFRATQLQLGNLEGPGDRFAVIQEINASMAFDMRGRVIIGDFEHGRQLYRMQVLGSTLRPPDGMIWCARHSSRFSPSNAAMPCGRADILPMCACMHSQLADQLILRGKHHWAVTELVHCWTSVRSCA